MCAMRLAAIPSVDRILQDPRLAPAIARQGRALVVHELRALLAQYRAALKAGAALPPSAEAIVQALLARLDAAGRSSLRRVFNLTGTVLHTNLGRALLPTEAIEAQAAASAQPANLEYDLEAGGRGERDAHLEALLCRLTGAEAATVVNNNAGAVLLALNALAAGREVPVSRGELVEIGGAFRIPEIIEAAGCTLREVGTTNRTHLADYERRDRPAPRRRSSRCTRATTRSSASPPRLRKASSRRLRMRAACLSSSIWAAAAWSNCSAGDCPPSPRPRARSPPAPISSPSAGTSCSAARRRGSSSAGASSSRSCAGIR
jgi:hypothetical protein